MTWFQTIIDHAAFGHEGRWPVGQLAALDGDFAITTSGYAFPIADEVLYECFADRIAYDNPEELVGDNPFHVLTVTIDTGVIDTAICVLPD